MLPKIYAFTLGEVNSQETLTTIASCGYDEEKEGDRERAINEIQKEIQYYEPKKLFLIDGIKLVVIPVNTIERN